MNAANVLTARYQEFTSNEYSKVEDYLKKCDYPIVIKADGIAAGKGVIICRDF
ncbi:MAG: hypothetical protein ACUVRG_08870 [Ignavibacterium sp.]|uniref:hypothetical protein n=1 Tax=Ignavibacterium sp. TaxID=2651167 RepID=UPI0040493183